MIRVPKFVYAVFVGALLFAGIGIITARAWDVGALWPATVHSADPDSNPGIADPDYVYGWLPVGSCSYQASRYRRLFGSIHA